MIREFGDLRKGNNYLHEIQMKKELWDLREINNYINMKEFWDLRKKW